MPVECTREIKGTVTPKSFFFTRGFELNEGVMKIGDGKGECPSLGMLRDGGGGLRADDVSE